MGTAEQSAFYDVIVVGGGPTGSVAATDLAIRGIRTLVLEKTDGSIPDARATATNVRTMEFMRRFGVEEEIRDCGWPRDRVLDVVYGPGVYEPEIARIPWPAIGDASPSEYSPTSYQRCPQRWLNPILARTARRQPLVDFRFHWEMTSFEQNGAGVTVHAKDRRGRTHPFRARYLLACDGVRSRVRRTLGIGAQVWDELGHSVEALIRSPQLAGAHSVRSGGHYTLVEPSGMSVALWPLDGVDLFRVTLMVHRKGGTKEDIADAVRRLGGDREIQFEFVSDVFPWTNRIGVRERFRDGRVFLVGDAAHSMPTTGGFGMNTGVLDAVDIAWKLAAVIRGWGHPDLLDTYEIERKPSSAQTAALAAAVYRDWQAMKGHMRSLAHRPLKGTDPEAVATRRVLGEFLSGVFGREFNATGGALGYRYDNSPICVPDGTDAPPYAFDTYVPTARPGHRAPHAWLPDGSSTLDLYGDGMVLLCLGGRPAAEAADLLAAAGSREVPLTVVEIGDPTVAALYERAFVLVRPDGMVAWRGDELPADPGGLIDTVRGARRAGSDRLPSSPSKRTAGRRGTLCLTVDNLGTALAVGRQRAARPDADEPGLRLGVPAFLRLFADLGLRSTFFVEGWNALHHPDVIERIASMGHEIGLHGWVHERWAEELDDRTREQLLWDGTAALRLAGFDPVAFRAPGGYRGGRTLDVLGELGYRVDSSIDEDTGAPGTTPAVTTLPNGLVSIPWTWDMIDFWHYNMRPDGPRAPDQVAEDWIGLTEAAADRGGLVTLIIHPFVSGVEPTRMAALRRVLEHALRHPGIDVLSAGRLAEVHSG